MKKNKKNLTKKIVVIFEKSIFIIDIIFFIIFMIFFIYIALYILKNMGCNLTANCKCFESFDNIVKGNRIEIFGILIGLFAYYKYSLTKVQQLRANMRSESGWRSRLFDLEKNEKFTFEDLLLLNACINPFNEDEKNIDYYVNKSLLSLVKYDNKDLEKNERLQIEDLKNVFKGILKDGKVYKKSYVPTLFDYSEDNFKYMPKSEDPQDSKKYLDLSEDEIKLIRLCIHALLKWDWKKSINDNYELK